MDYIINFYSAGYSGKGIGTKAAVDNLYYFLEFFYEKRYW